MKAIIIDDEKNCITSLAYDLAKYCPEITIEAECQGGKEGLLAIKKYNPDIVFLDIDMPYINGFEMLEMLPEINFATIFTTAYDEYSLKAFKVNSIDYLLKPIEEEELEAAFQKFERLHQQQISYNPQAFQEILSSLTQKNYKERFLVKAGQNLINLSVSDIAYFYSEEGMLYARCNDSKRHMLDHTLEQIEYMVDPKSYFRINRKALIRISAIDKIQTHINSRLKLQLKPATTWDVIVSRERVGTFKSWLDR